MANEYLIDAVLFVIENTHKINNYWIQPKLDESALAAQNIAKFRNPCLIQACIYHDHKNISSKRKG